MKPRDKILEENKNSIKVKIGKYFFRFFTDGSLYKIKGYIKNKNVNSSRKLIK
jgi:hypothetical protein